MSNILWKSFNVCFSKFKCIPTITFSSPSTTEEQQQQQISHASVLIKNYNSLYELSSSSSSPEADSVPDFSSAFASHRFFCSSPGSSNSLLSPPETYAVKKYSPDPLADFRGSMQEMIEARESTGAEADWEFLNELLVCYLALNPKHTHKFIFGAFADVIVSVVGCCTAAQTGV